MALILKNYDMETKLKIDIPWNEVKEKLMEADTNLADTDLEYNGVNASKLLEKVANKMNKSVEDVKAWIESVAFTKGISS